MYMTMRMLSAKFKCSQDTIRRRVKEMEASGNYPSAIRRVCGVEIDDVQFEHFCTIGRRKRNDD